MLIAVLNEDQRIVLVFDTEVHVDEGVTGVEIDRDTFEHIFANGGSFGDWIYNDGVFSFDPLPPPPPPKKATTPQPGEIPRSVL